VSVRIIGLSGPAGSGKDTAASLLVALHGFTRLAYADGIKRSFSDLENPTRNLSKELQQAGEEVWYPWLLLGSESREEAAGALGIPIDCGWLWLAATKITYLAQRHPRPRRDFVIPDVRFGHEPQMRHLADHLGGHYETWKIVSPTHESSSRFEHISEQCYDQVRIDRVVANDKTLGVMELARQLEVALSGMKAHSAYIAPARECYKPPRCRMADLDELFGTLLHFLGEYAVGDSGQEQSIASLRAICERIGLDVDRVVNQYIIDARYNS
jgi:hypothetical protein